jgi:putative PIN family toxin of toxin-antitoxin system
MSKSNLKIVLDTNIFLVSIASNHRYSWIYDALIDGKFDLCVSNEILTEYEEIIVSRYGIQLTKRIFNGILLLPNIIQIDPHYNWPLLSDADDNKFIDCSVAGNADFIVSNDKVFKELKKVEFPPLKVLKYLEFEERYKREIIG